MCGGARLLPSDTPTVVRPPEAAVTCPPRLRALPRTRDAAGGARLRSAHESTPLRMAPGAVRGRDGGAARLKEAAVDDAAADACSVECADRLECIGSGVAQRSCARHPRLWCSCRRPRGARACRHRTAAATSRCCRRRCAPALLLNETDGGQPLTGEAILCWRRRTHARTGLRAAAHHAVTTRLRQTWCSDLCAN